MNKKRNIIFGIILVLVFFLIFLLNNKTLFVSDDYIYHYVFDSRIPIKSTRRVKTLVDVVKSMKSHYYLWGGRIVCHFFLQIVFIFGKTVFNIFNSLMFLIFGYLIYKHVNTEKKVKPLLLAIIYAMIFVFVPQPGSTIFWKSGSANYLWASNIMLGFTLIYKKYYDNDNIKDNFLNMFLLLIYGLIVGCLNENSGCALIISEILYIIYFKLKNKEIPKWFITGLVGTITGYIILLIAPGNFVRADVMYEKVDYSIPSLFKNFLILTRLTSDYIKTIIYILIVSIFLYKKNRSKNIKEIFLNNFLQINYILFSLASIYSLIISPAYPERCWFFAFIFILITIGINVNLIDKKNDLYIKLMKIFSVIIIFISISEYSMAFYTIDLSQKDLTKQLVEIKKQKKSGKKDIVVRAVYNHTGKYNAFTENGYLSYNENSWFNLWMAEYYGLKSIKTIE